jgi:hypothetical protein
MSLGTGACGPGTVAVCAGSQNPAVDPSSVTLQVPAGNGAPAQVAVQELSLPPATEDSRALGQDIYAHADGLTTDRTQPATITLRFSQADVMSTPLDQVQVAHISDGGVMTQTPDCLGPDLPAGANYCIVRPVTRDAQNTFVTIRTIETSRWRLRRIAGGESFAQTAPGAPSGATATLARPRDGSAVLLSWAAPANDGGAATTSYRVYRDGRLVATTSETSAKVTDVGPGTHQLTVAAVNAFGEGAQSAAATIKLKKLSKPRKVKAVQGKKGGKLTAGAKWKRPASAGGYAVTKYKVVVFTKSGKKVAIKIVRASKHKFLFKLKPGRYYFKVRARNSHKWGPWSKKTTVVRPR